MTETRDISVIHLDHSPGKFSYSEPNWCRVIQERTRMLQEIHDERDPIRIREMMANFVSPEKKDAFSISLPFRCEFGYNIHLGIGASIHRNATILDSSKVTIGQGTLVAPDVKIYTATHASDPDERLQDNQAKMEYRFPVTIGNNCWIGGGATILPGVTIGDGVTVAAGAVVTQDVERRCVVAGVAAKVVKRFPSTIRIELSKSEL